MMFEEELASQQKNSTALGRRNTENFFNAAGIDRKAFEAFTLRRFDADSCALYVSTVPRGLAGSTSDIDLILLVKSPVAPTDMNSNMLFFQNRRVGLKQIYDQDVASTFNALETICSHGSDLNLVAQTLKQQPVKWADLERVVYGISFSTDSPFLDKLPILGRAAVAISLRNFAANALLCNIAARGAYGSGVYAYGFAALTAAMDVIMALCGRIQSNTKWTFERWRRFAAEPSGDQIGSFVAPITTLYQSIMRLQATEVQTVTEQLQSIGQLLAKSVDRWGWSASANLRLPTNVVAGRFLPNATSLCRMDLAAAVATEVVQPLLAQEPLSVDDMPRDSAAAILKLIQHGLIETYSLPS